MTDLHARLTQLANETEQLWLNHHPVGAQWITDRLRALAHAPAEPPGPTLGYPFLFDGRPFVSTLPTMTVGEILKLAGRPVQGIYRFVEERDGAFIYFDNLEQAVDLTRPRVSLFYLPPATLESPWTIR